MLISKEALLDAMTSAHIYKDALRKKNVSPAGAFLLVPKSSELPRLAEIDFHELYGEGVFKLEDESDTRLLLERLIGFMQA